MAMGDAGPCTRRVLRGVWFVDPGCATSDGPVHLVVSDVASSRRSSLRVRVPERSLAAK